MYSRYADTRRRSRPKIPLNRPINVVIESDRQLANKAYISIILIAIVTYGYNYIQKMNNEEHPIRKEYKRNDFNKYGFDRAGFDKDGFDKNGFDRNGFNQDGFNCYGFNKNGFDRNGFNKNGFDKNGFNRDGFNKNGFDIYGFNRDGFDKHGYDKDGFNLDGFNKNGFNHDGFNKYGYDQKGFNKYGYDKYGYDQKGFNKYGYDRDGFNKEGYDSYGYGIDGYDKYGFNRNGFDSRGYDRKGFNKKNIHKITKTKYNVNGYDHNGYDKNGYDKDGFNKYGYNANGFDRNGIRMINNNKSIFNIFRKLIIGFYVSVFIVCVLCYIDKKTCTHVSNNNDSHAVCEKNNLHNLNKLDSHTMHDKNDSHTLNKLDSHTLHALNKSDSHVVCSRNELDLNTTNAYAYRDDLIDQKHYMPKNDITNAHSYRDDLNDQKEDIHRNSTSKVYSYRDDLNDQKEDTSRNNTSNVYTYRDDLSDQKQDTHRSSVTKTYSYRDDLNDQKEDIHRNSTSNVYYSYRDTRLCTSRGCLIVDDDLDGLSAVVISRFLGIQWGRIIYKSELFKSRSELKQFQFVVYVDLLPNAYERNISHYIYVYDHHDEFNLCPEKGECVIDNSKCGSKIFYEQFIRKKLVNLNYAKIIKAYLDLISIHDIGEDDNKDTQKAFKLCEMLYSYRQRQDIIDRAFYLLDSCRKCNDTYFERHFSSIDKETIKDYRRCINSMDSFIKSKTIYKIGSASFIVIDKSDIRGIGIPFHDMCRYYLSKHKTYEGIICKYFNDVPTPFIKVHIRMESSMIITDLNPNFKGHPHVGTLYIDQDIEQKWRSGNYSF